MHAQKSQAKPLLNYPFPLLATPPQGEKVSVISEQEQDMKHAPPLLEGLRRAAAHIRCSLLMPPSSRPTHGAMHPCCLPIHGRYDTSRQQELGGGAYSERMYYIQVCTKTA